MRLTYIPDKTRSNAHIVIADVAENPENVTL